MNFKKEILNYIIFGIFTSIVNIATYLLLTDVFNVYYVFANILAWIISVFFAYFTNRTWVFESENTNLIKEAVLFFGGRLFSGVLDTGLMILFIDILTIGDLISKVVVQIIVVIVNYVFSKWIVFK